MPSRQQYLATLVPIVVSRISDEAAGAQFCKEIPRVPANRLVVGQGGFARKRLAQTIVRKARMGASYRQYAT
jgi:hypothetical protein